MYPRLDLPIIEGLLQDAQNHKDELICEEMLRRLLPLYDGMIRRGAVASNGDSYDARFEKSISQLLAMAKTAPVGQHKEVYRMPPEHS